MKKIKIFDLNIKIESRQELVDAIGKSLKGNEQLFVSKINSEFLVRAKENKEFSLTLNQSNHFVIDGVGPCWIAKYLTLPITDIPVLRHFQAIWQMVYTGASLVFRPKFCTYPIQDRIPGREAFRLMLGIAEKTNSPIFLFGATDETLAKAKKIIKLEFPKLIIAGSRNGYDYIDDDVVKEINETDAKMLFVAQGSPQQENWIIGNLNKLKNIRVAVGEGGTLEFVAGNYKTPPKILQKLGIEWFWRMFVNKNKTTGAGSRYIRVYNGVTKLIIEAVRYKIKFGQVEVSDEKN